jgi:hypothetical protein
LANTGNIVINTNNYAGNTAQWTFGTDGVLTLPAGSSRITSYGQITIETDNNASGMYLNADGVNLLYANTNVTLRANSTGTNKDWNFGNTGVLTLPNSAVIRDTVGNAVAFGRDAAATGPQGNAAVAIGQQAGDTSQGQNSVAIGMQAGTNTQNANAVAIGGLAGSSTQGTSAVAVGQGAGQASQGSYAVAIGANAGNTSQGAYAVAIGVDAGKTNQGINSVAVGINAGNTSQGIYATAVGAFAGYENQGNTAVAIGQNTGVYTQGEHAVAVGLQAGFSSQGISAIAIGHLAGYTSQGNNSIILNATGSALDQTTANTFTVAPVRNDVANVAQVMFYNTTSKEITYGNVISVAGNITGGNILTGGLVSATGNVTGNYIFGNGSQLTGITANTGNVTFSNQIVLGTGTNDGGGGLYLAPGTDSIANSAVQYLRVRGGDYPTHIHLDTGNNAYYDQYFGADTKYVKLEANGNIVINAT